MQVAATNCSCCCCNTTTVLAAYSYDALGRRIKETHGSTTTDLYYSNQWQVLEQVQGSTVTADNVWSPVYVDALVLVKQIQSCGPTQLLYVQQDANWNVTAVVNSAGVQQRFVYTPFGVQTVLQANFTASGSSAMIVYGYQGGRYDSATGQYSFQRRDYSPTLQRWIEQDPLRFDAGDSNFYRYVRNEPTIGTDPLGLQPAAPPVQNPPVDPFAWVYELYQEWIAKDWQTLTQKRAEERAWNAKAVKKLDEIQTAMDNPRVPRLSLIGLNTQYRNIQLNQRSKSSEFDLLASEISNLRWQQFGFYPGNQFVADQTIASLEDLSTTYYEPFAETKAQLSTLRVRINRAKKSDDQVLKAFAPDLEATYHEVSENADIIRSKSKGYARAAWDLILDFYH